ncbi:MAG TPA: substrate-binding domain-containing protein [Vicinamibacterales bacterium]|nr:substrate-binding domain-containing protein [Vicinamibacterales bacterium]
MRRRLASVVVAALLLVAPAVAAQDITVATSGAFSAALHDLLPQFEQTAHHRVTVVSGASMGDTPDSIPNRLKRHEAIDVVILADTALDDLMKSGAVSAGSRVDLVRSRIGMVVKKGAPKPDISSVDALVRTLKAAKSVAYSSSASGVYLSTQLFPKLGLVDDMRAKGKIIDIERVAAVVARGDAEVGFQQISELLPEPGVDLVGPLPDAAQKITIFSAGIVAGSHATDVVKTLIAYLTSPAAAAAIRRSGLDPM